MNGTHRQVVLNLPNVFHNYYCSVRNFLRNWHIDFQSVWKRFALPPSIKPCSTSFQAWSFTCYFCMFVCLVSLCLFVFCFLFCFFIYLSHTDMYKKMASQGRFGSGTMQPSLRSANLSSGFPQGNTPAEMNSHLARTSSSQIDAGIYKICVVCRLFSLSIYCWFFGWFLILLY